GYTTPDLAAVNNRARELCEQLENQSKFLDVLGGQWVFHLLRGELDQAEHHAAEMRSLAIAGKGAVEQFWASARSGEVRFYLGRFIDARSYFEKRYRFTIPHFSQSMLESALKTRAQQHLYTCHGPCCA